MEQSVDKKRHRKRHESWNLSIRAVLDAMNLGYKIDRPSKLMMNDIINQFNQRLSKLSIRLCAHASKKTVSVKDVQAATRIATSGDLAKHAERTGTTAVKDYKSASQGDKIHPLSRSSRAKILFPVSKVDRILKKNAEHCCAGHSRQSPETRCWRNKLHHDG